MCAVFSFSFQSKWDFDINEDYLAGRSDSSVYHAVPKPRPGFKENGVNRQVDFSPRYHQISLHKEDASASKHCEDTRQLPKISYTAPLKSNDLYKQRLLEIKRRRGSSEEPIKDFKVSMHCSCKDDDCVKLARDRLSRYDHPYKNPKPHDFRPVCLCTGSDVILITSQYIIIIMYHSVRADQRENRDTTEIYPGKLCI